MAQILAPSQNLERINDIIPRKRIDRWKDRQKDGRKDGRTEGQIDPLL